MLADTVLANPRMSGEHAHPTFLKDVQSAHRFVLSSEFVVAASEMADTRPSSFCHAVDLARPPYELTWMEFDNPLGSRASTRGAYKTISKIGALIRTEGQGYSITITFEMADGLLLSFPIAAYVNPHLFGWHRKSSLFDRMTDDECRRGIIRDRPEIASNEKEVSALIKLARCVTNDVSPYHADVLPRIRDALGEKRYQDIISENLVNLHFEAKFCMSCLVMIASRNASRIDAGPELNKINKRRLSSNKKPLLSYHICRISDRIRLRTSVGAGGGDASVRAHFVRGHFKIRASGVFWWSPFLRGDAKRGLVMKDYEVA